MDITIIADTHGLQEEIKLKPGTMLIHAGDVTEYGSEEEVIEFLLWFAKQPFKYKIFIAGNHDVFFEECNAAKRKEIIPKDIIYLQNSGVEIEGLKIWGSPVTPYFLGMAFNARRGKDIKKIWNKLPIDTDILITHGPPKGILDNDFGCEELLNRVNTIRPKIHCFGHVHGWNDVQQQNQTTFINAAMVNNFATPEEMVYKIIANPTIIKLVTIPSAEEIPFLNNLNAILKKIEQELIDHATELLILAKKRLKDKNTLTTDFGVEAIIRYQSIKEDEYYNCNIKFNYKSVVVDKNYGFFLDNGNNTDIHKVDKMPALAAPYCYLLRNLMDHNKRYFTIYNITEIDISIYYTDEKKLKIKIDGTATKISLAGNGIANESEYGLWITI